MTWLSDHILACLVLSGVLLSFVGQAIAAMFYDQKNHKHRTKALILPLLGIVIGGVAAFWMNDRQIAAAVKRAEFEREMRLKADENLKRTDEAIAQITGGDAYCDFGLLMPDAAGQVRGVLNQHGAYTCRDVHVVVEDTSRDAAWVEAERAAGRMPDDLANWRRFKDVLDYGDVGRGSIGFDPSISWTIPAGSTSQGYMVTTLMTNKSVETTYSYRRVGKKWFRRFRSNLLAGGKSTTLVVQIDPGFPDDRK